MKDKIYIVGMVGSGKTTLAKHLSKKYNINHFQLDKIVFDDEDNNRRRTDEEINNLFKEILYKDKWIIEDVGRKYFREGLAEADIIYYLNVKKASIYMQMTKRWVLQKVGLEEYDYKPTIKSYFESLSWIRRGYKNKKQMLATLMLYKDKVIFLNKKEINEMEER